METDVHADDEIMNIKNACEYLKISKGLLRKLPIERIRIRRRVLFKKSAILKFLKDNTKEIKDDRTFN